MGFVFCFFNIILLQNLIDVICINHNIFSKLDVICVIILRLHHLLNLNLLTLKS